jgi:putative (di)nucleoside polyphosphate hydrolase
MSSLDFTALPYRACAGVMLLNRRKQVFVGQRLDSAADAWQMPQGGVDPGEEPEQTAYRELEEETGIPRRLVSLVARSKGTHLYDLPPHLMGKMWGGRYRGQCQTWFLMHFKGRDADVNIETAHPEFEAWQWVAPTDLEKLIVPFKKKLYRDVVAEFHPYLT